jgi:hypothetical protein
MSAPLIPWETCNIPTEIQKEWNRRKTNFGFNYRAENSKTDGNGWEKEGGDWEKYKGPMTSWVRVCSNSLGHPEINKPTFVFMGGKGFYQTYGFKWNQEANQQILGWTADNKHPHTLEYDAKTSQFPIHVPTPEIVRVESIINKELFRRVTIHWKCFSAKQLEYMTPYFLIPGITMTVEFGWNHYNPKSLLNLNDTDALARYYWENPYELYSKNILESNGNYDVVFGMVTNYEWSVEGNTINCITEITSKDRLYSGIPISAIVSQKKNVERNEEQNKIYFSNIRQICKSNFINNLKAISSATSLDQVLETDSNKQLLQTIKGGTGIQQMPDEYWRGVFWGRDEKIITKVNSSNNKDFSQKWSKGTKTDFDKDLNGSQMWVNLGFLCELLNRCLPTPNPKGSLFFSVDVENSVIGAHPNHISTKGNVLLIPNAKAPRYMYGSEGLKSNGPGSDWDKEWIRLRKKTQTVEKNTVNKNDPYWFSNVQLCEIFKQGTYPLRDNLDEVINVNRYIWKTERKKYCFPFQSEETIKIGETEAKYEPYLYGYFKDLYFNLTRFIQLVEDSNTKTYFDLYNAIFDDINSAGGNFWNFSLTLNELNSKLVIVDNNMLPSGNNVSTPWYFDYADADQLMTSLAFKPKMSEAQAARVVFSETNNKKAKVSIDDENDLLDYQFEDRILSERNKFDASINFSDNQTYSTNPFLKQIQTLQNQQPTDEMYPFTIISDGITDSKRLVLPDPELLKCLIDDNNLEKNQRYSGLQPITVEVSLQGIGGLRTFMTFMIRNLPNPYNHKDVAYRIVDVHHTLQEGKWETTIKAGIIPLRGYVKNKMGINT